MGRHICDWLTDEEYIFFNNAFTCLGNPSFGNYNKKRYIKNTIVLLGFTLLGLKKLKN